MQMIARTGAPKGSGFAGAGSAAGDIGEGGFVSVPGESIDGMHSSTDGHACFATCVTNMPHMRYSSACVQRGGRAAARDGCSVQHPGTLATVASCRPHAQGNGRANHAAYKVAAHT